MSFKGRLRKMAERLTGTHIYRSLPRGVDLPYDIASSLPNCRMDVLFDVGANTGQSAQRFLDWFPAARIYCFEPVQDTYRKLQENLGSQARVQCFRLALGSSVGKGKMALPGRSILAFLEGQSKQPRPAAERTEEVDVSTVDQFCRSGNIDAINYLKIDTEGGDIEILKGARTLLTAGRIDLVEVEAGMNAGNPWHVPFEALKGFLESKGYALFALYEQVNEWPAREPQLRRANAVFISPRVIETNRR